MSDMFESLDLNMREEADRVNPTKAIMASQLECEKRFEGFVAKNPERIDFIADDIRSVSDKYAAQYDISSDTVYEATVSHLKQAAVKQVVSNYPPGEYIVNQNIGPNINSLADIEKFWNSFRQKLEQILSRENLQEDLNDGSPRAEELYGEITELEMQIEQLKNELEGIEGEEEGSEKYWALEEQISDALNSLYSLSEGQSFLPVRQTESSVKTANIEWQHLGDNYYRANGPHGEWNLEPQSREDQLAMGLDEWDMDGEPRQDRYQLIHVPRGNDLLYDVRDVHYSLPEAFEAARQRQSDWNDRDRKRSSVDKESFEWTDLINPVGLIKNIPDAAAATGNLIGDAVGAMGNSPVGQATKALVQPGAMLQGLVGQGPAADLGQAMTTSPAAELAKGLAGGAGNAKAGPFMSTSSVADQKLAAFLTAHQDVLFPELTKLGLTWQDMLQRSNLWGNKINPENIWQKKNPDKNLVPAPTQGGELNAPMTQPSDENPTEELPVINRAPRRNPATGQIDGSQENLVNPEGISDKNILEADRLMREKALKRQEMIEGAPEMVGGRGRHRGEYLRGASVLQDALVNYYVSTGMPQRTASILVEAVGEMAQLQQDSPGLPVADSEPKSVNPNTAIGGKEGDKYQNWDVNQKQKELGVEHQDSHEPADDPREFIQHDKAPYSENTKKDIFEGAEESNMNAKKVKQDDNAPKKSSVKSSNMSVEEIKAKIKELEGYTKRDLSAGEAFGPDHGQDDAAEDELHDLKQLLKEKTEG